MVNNVTNINKASLPKLLNTLRPRHMALEINVMAWDSHKNVMELKQ